jgi:cation transport ATPase
MAFSEMPSLSFSSDNHEGETTSFADTNDSLGDSNHRRNSPPQAQESTSPNQSRHQRPEQHQHQSQHHRRQHHNINQQHDSSTPEVVFALARAVAGVVAMAALLFLGVLMIFVKTLIMNGVGKYGIFSLLLALTMIMVGLSISMGIPFILTSKLYLGALS